MTDTNLADITVAPQDLQSPDGAMTEDYKKASAEVVTQQMVRLTSILKERMAQPIIITRAQFKQFEPLFKDHPDNLTPDALARFQESMEPLAERWKRLIKGDVYAFVHVVQSETNPALYLEIAPPHMQMVSIEASKENCMIIDSVAKDRHSAIPLRNSTAQGKLMTLFKYAQFKPKNLGRIQALRGRVAEGAEDFLRRKYGNDYLHGTSKKKDGEVVAAEPVTPTFRATEEIFD